MLPKSCSAIALLKQQRFIARERFAHDRILDRCVEIRKFIMPEGFVLRRIRFALRKLHNSLVSEGFAHDTSLDRTGEIAIARTDS